MENIYSRVATLAGHASLNLEVPNYSRSRAHVPAQHEIALAEETFRSMLTLERRRAARSGKSFVLMLIDANVKNGTPPKIAKQIVDIALTMKRETDLVGWYKENAILGVIFTEVNVDEGVSVTEILRAKTDKSLVKHLGRERVSKIAITVHLFPDGRKKHHWVAD